MVQISLSPLHFSWQKTVKRQVPSGLVALPESVLKTVSDIVNNPPETDSYK